MTTPSDRDSSLGKIFFAAAAGALAMYLFDPERGPRRRAAAGAKLRDLGQDTGNALTSVVDELAHRAGAADVFHATDSEHDSYAGGNGAARGLAPSSLGSIFSKPASGIEAIAQGLRERSWDPKVRNAAMWGSGALGLFGLANRRSTLGPLATVAGLAGAALLARRGGTAQPGGAAQIEKTIRIDASPEQVYDMWAHYENFPRFMANVIEVRDLGANLSHWVVKGPAGSRFEWDSILTEQARPHRLSWRSVPGAQVEHRGEVWLEPIHGGTRATVRMSYTPPGGAAGQVIATLLGGNPKAQLEDDLQRLKSLLERGSLPHASRHTEHAPAKFLH